MGFGLFMMDGNADVSTVSGVGGFVRGGKPYTLPKQARGQLRHAPMMISFAVAVKRTAGFCLRETDSIVAQGGGSVKQKMRDPGDKNTDTNTSRRFECFRIPVNAPF